MTPADSGWFVLISALAILPLLIFFECAQQLCYKFKLMMTKTSKIKSVDQLGREVKVVQQIKINVEIINGQCFVENGDPELNAKCNAALAEMNDFQREFIARVPEGKPNNVVFTEEIIEHQYGVQDKRAYFEPAQEVSLPERILSSISSWCTCEKR